MDFIGSGSWQQGASCDSSKHFITLFVDGGLSMVQAYFLSNDKAAAASVNSDSLGLLSSGFMAGKKSTWKTQHQK